MYTNKPLTSNNTFTTNDSNEYETTSSFDFNLDGSRTALIKRSVDFQFLQIYDVDTNHQCCQYQMKDIGNMIQFSWIYYHCWVLLDEETRCRWSPDSSEACVYLKHEKNKINIFEVEKQKLILRDSVKIQEKCKFILKTLN